MRGSTIAELKGTVDHAQMRYIIRDHSMEKFQGKKDCLRKVVDLLKDRYGDIITLDMRDEYYNMKEKIQPHMEIIELAKSSMEELGIQPLIKPIRGGTDGSRLSYMGLPCPNLFTGGYNFHGRFEFIPVESLKMASRLITKIAENNTKK